MKYDEMFVGHLKDGDMLDSGSLTTVFSKIRAAHFAYIPVEIDVSDLISYAWASGWLHSSSTREHAIVCNPPSITPKNSDVPVTQIVDLRRVKITEYYADGLPSSKPPQVGYFLSTVAADKWISTHPLSDSQRRTEIKTVKGAQIDGKWFELHAITPEEVKQQELKAIHDKLASAGLTRADILRYIKET